MKAGLPMISAPSPIFNLVNKKNSEASDTSFLDRKDKTVPTEMWPKITKEHQQTEVIKATSTKHSWPNFQTEVKYYFLKVCH